MKICLVARQYDRVFSGPGTYCRNLISELKNTKHKVTLILPLLSEKYPVKETKGNITIRRIKCFNYKKVDYEKLPHLKSILVYIPGLKKFFKSNKLDDFDIVHILDINHSFFLKKNMFKKSKVVISINDFYALITPFNYFKFTYPCSDKPIRYIYYHLMKKIYTSFLKKADFVFTNTKFLAKTVHTHCKIPKNKIFTIYRGISYNPKLISKKNKYKSHKILFIGKNVERKGLMYLIKAMPAIIEKYPDTVLIIIGRLNKAAYRKVKMLITNFKIEKNIKIIPHLAYDKVLSLYNNINVFVLPSIIENLAQTLLEAMASKTPIVVTAVNANPEAVSSKEGILIKPKSPSQIAEAVIKLFSNPSLAKRMGNNGYSKVKNFFNKKRMVDETINIYKKIKEHNR